MSGDNLIPEGEKYPSVAKISQNLATWVKDNRWLFILSVILVLTSLIPLYGVLVPPNVDLPEHILISKLLFEKLTGVSQMDMEISFFIAYRLVPVLFVSIMGIFKFLGIPFIYLPSLIVTVFISFHAIVVVTILYFALRQKNLTSYTYAACFMLPAVVCLYSACWFIGFVNFTLAITLLLPTLFLTERFLQSGKVLDGLLVFIPLLLVYSAHPFAPTFWLLWCLSRSIVTVATGSFFVEWKRLLALGLIFFPIFLYHFVAISGTEFAAGDASFLSRSLFIGLDEWYKNRLGNMVSGEMVKVDEAGDSRIFAIVVLGMIAFSTILAFRVSRSEVAKRLALSSVIFLFLTSWINEKFFPIPVPHWLAYDYRFASVAYAVCMTIAAWILIRFIPRAGDKPVYRWVFMALAVVSVLGTADHLFEVRKAYARYDAPAREYVAKALRNEELPVTYLPHGRWHPDGTLARLYICLEQTDCNPKGTTFESFGGSLYAVRIKSTNRVPPTAVPAANSDNSKSVANPDSSEPVNAFAGGVGQRPGQFASPRGLAVDRKGNVYVADTDNGRVQKFDPEGNFIAVIGRLGTGEGQLKGPHGITIDSADNIYVLDIARGMLIKLDPDGKFLKEWKGPEDGFFGPRDLSIGSNKNIYIVDQGRARIVRFDPATEAFTSWGTSGDGEGQFRESTGIAFGGGLMYIADLGNDRIQVFDLDGKFVRQWAVPVWEKYVWHYPDVAFDEQAKRLYASNGWKKEVLVFDENGNAAGEGFKPTGADSLHNPSALVISVVGKERRLYVLNTDDARVSYFKLEPLQKK